MQWMMRLAAVVWLGACISSEESREYLAERDSLGIRVIDVLDAPAETLHVGGPSVRIGATGLGAEGHELFERVSDVALLPAGQIVVVDNRGARVAVFDSSGAWLRDLGGAGGGPGEYTGPIEADARGDTVFLWDALQRRLSRYSADGAFLGSVVFPERSAARPFAVIDSGYVLEEESGQLMDPDPARGWLVGVGRDGSVADTLVGPYSVPERGWRVTNAQSGAGHMVNPPALATYPSWAVARDLLHRLDPQTSNIEVRTVASGGLESLVRLPYEAQPPTRQARDDYFNALQAELGIPEEVMAQERAGTEFVSLRPAVAALLADGEGALWIARHDAAAFDRDYIGTGWDVIDLPRRRGTHLVFPAGTQVVAVRDGRAYGIATLESGVKVVDVFRPGG